MSYSSEYKYGSVLAEFRSRRSCSIVGTSIPSYAGDLVKSGTIGLITAWDPALAGEAMNTVAKLISEGKTVKTGDNLGVPGYENVNVVGDVIYGSAWLDMDPKNIDQYKF